MEIVDREQNAGDLACLRRYSTRKRLPSSANWTAPLVLFGARRRPRSRRDREAHSSRGACRRALRRDGRARAITAALRRPHRARATPGEGARVVQSRHSPTADRRPCIPGAAGVRCRTTVGLAVREYLSFAQVPLESEEADTSWVASQDESFGRVQPIEPADDELRIPPRDDARGARAPVEGRIPSPESPIATRSLSWQAPAPPGAGSAHRRCRRNRS